MSGQVVFDKKYFSRPRDEKKLWRLIERESHLILLSPRRAGKTSILRHLEHNPKPGYIFLYAMVQSCETEHQFYQQVLESLSGADFLSNLQKIKNKTAGFVSDLVTKAFNRIDSISIQGNEVSFKASSNKLTYKDFAQVIKDLGLDEKLIIILDEYPDVLEKIHAQESFAAARTFLSNIRTLTQDIDFTSRAQIIITGSIGLDTLTSRLGLTNLTNDTDRMHLTPLTQDEAHAFIAFLIKKNNSDMQLNPKTTDYLLHKVQWLMPYYIEILWERLDDECIDNEQFSPQEKDIDAAFEMLFHQTYRKCFSHWVERLFRFEDSEKAFAKDVLNLIARQDRVVFSDCFNISKLEQYTAVNAPYVMDCLEHDGYIFEDAQGVFSFTTPMLKEWWRRYADRTI